MGIQGLLPLLKEAQLVENISAYAGQRLAVDAYVWLHKGAFGCAEQLVKGQRTTRFVDYAMHRVRLMRHHKIQPVIVFDGGYLPAKQGTEESREKSRAAGLARAIALEAQGRTREARDFYTKCVDVTPEMAFQLIKALRVENVDYIVAPYEADAQLCYLEREGLVDGIITEDSDLLVFGCQKVIFKLDGNGDCMSIHRSRFDKLREFPMGGWTDLQFRRMAILSGCDYLDSIPGIGLKTAHRMMRRYKTVEKILQTVRLEGILKVPDTYQDDFTLAELAFVHQRVYDPRTQRMVPLLDLPETGLGEKELGYIGPEHEPEIARGIASGDLHPMTKLPIVDQWPSYKPLLAPTQGAKTVLGQSAKVNVIAGPMDKWVTRTPDAKSRGKPILPKPIGAPSSGPSRLSDLTVVTPRASRATRSISPPVEMSSPPLTGELKTSKFFREPGRFPKARARERKVEEDAPIVEVVWEDSGMDGPVTLADEGVRLSASPPWSTTATPVRSTAANVIDLTSPLGPDISSPPRVSPEPQSPQLSPIPGSPVPAEVPAVLIPQSSSSRVTGTATVDIEIVSSPPSAPVVVSRKRRREIARSSSVEEDEVMTPEAELALEEEDRIEKARKVAAGWRQRYSLSSVTKKQSPLTPRPGLSMSTPRAKSHQPTSLVTSRVLATKSLNIPAPPSDLLAPGFDQTDTPTKQPIKSHLRMTGAQKLQSFRFPGL